MSAIFNGISRFKSYSQQLIVLDHIMNKEIGFVTDGFDFEKLDDLCKIKGVEYHKRKVESGYILALKIA